MLIRRNLLACFLALPLVAAAQTAPAPQARSAAHAARIDAESAPAALSSKDVAATQRQLIELLRLSPKMTTVVSHDPSLLSDQDYVSRNNPQLAAFLTSHPEVSRNPDFYLFSHMNPGDGSPDEALEHAVWPEVYRMQPARTGFDSLLSDMAPVLGISIFLGAVIWGMRIFTENRRWSRSFKLQSEVHARLIDKFSSTQELAAYMETEAGKRFLEAAPIPLNAPMNMEQSLPSVLPRVLMSLRIGILAIFFGAGCLALRNADPELRLSMLVLGVLVVMPGIGFLVSAVVTWILAHRLGLLNTPPPAPPRFDAPYNNVSEQR